jgi:hypothetical protein
MQDRTTANSMKVLLQRTAGPYIRVKRRPAVVEKDLGPLLAILAGAGLANLAQRLLNELLINHAHCESPRD